MDWRSLSGLPGGLGVCGDGVVMQLLSGSSESWDTGGCVATHGQEVARRQWFTDRDLRVFVLCGVVPGAPDGVSHSGVRSEHRCYYRDGYIGINTATHTGYQERTAVYRGGVSLQLHPWDVALSGRIFTVGHCSIPPCSEAVLHCTTRTVGGRSLPSSSLLEGLTVFVKNTGLVVGRTLVDPSGWRVPVLISNFSQETVMVEPFSEIGMIAQVSAFQPVMDQPSRTSCDPSMLPDHLRRLLDLTSQDLDSFQRGQLASTLLQFVDLFPVPGSALTGHTDAVEHTINTGNSAPLCPSTDVASQD